ncbi:MAG: hypothetical protein LQ346_004481 [Caloplaca aetnensis]|nr:MAG: hypothetical protein LQ346_004481 [Caloplaca aetnensis]
MGEEEDDDAIDGNGLDDSRQADTVGPDITNGYLDPPIPRPMSATDTETLDISAWDRTFDTRQSSHPSAGWAVAQRSSTHGHCEGSASQKSLPTTEEADRAVDSGSNYENLTSLQDADMFTVPCTCLNELYAMLACFRPFPPPSFPVSRGPLTRATSLARCVVRCSFCPRDYPTALQNLMLMNTLLLLVAHGYAELLTHIQERSTQGEKITYRVGDASQANAHLHTGTPECPMGFYVELESEEWAVMARKVVKQDVFGNAQNIDCLIGVVEEMEQRQHIWHLLRPFSLNGSCTTEQPDDSHEHNGFCLQLTGRIRAAIDALHL